MKPRFLKVSNKIYGKRVLIQQNKIFFYQAFYRIVPKIMNKFQIFGEMGVIKNHSVTFHSKLQDRGSVAMFLGCAKDHSAEIYRFLKMGTKRVVLSSDVI